MELACVLEPFQREFNLDYLKKQITKDKNDEIHRALSDTIEHNRCSKCPYFEI